MKTSETRLRQAAKSLDEVAIEADIVRMLLDKMERDLDSYPEHAAQACVLSNTVKKLGMTVARCIANLGGRTSTFGNKAEDWFPESGPDAYTAQPQQRESTSFAAEPAHSSIRSCSMYSVGEDWPERFMQFPENMPKGFPVDALNDNVYRLESLLAVLHTGLCGETNPPMDNPQACSLVWCALSQVTMLKRLLDYGYESQQQQAIEE